jgi:hypothetical protein
MDTVVKAGSLATSAKTLVSTRTKSSVSTSDFWKEAEYNRYGITPMILLVVVCIGGIAAAAAGDSIPQLIIVSLATTLTLTTIIAVSPMKTIVAFSCVVLLIDIAMIVASMF